MVGYYSVGNRKHCRRAFNADLIALNDTDDMAVTATAFSATVNMLNAQLMGKEGWSCGCHVDDDVIFHQNSIMATWQPYRIGIC